MAARKLSPGCKLLRERLKDISRAIPADLPENEARNLEHHVNVVEKLINLSTQRQETRLAKELRDAERAAQKAVPIDKNPTDENGMVLKGAKLRQHLRKQEERREAMGLVPPVDGEIKPVGGKGNKVLPSSTVLPEGLEGLEPDEDGYITREDGERFLVAGDKMVRMG